MERYAHQPNFAALDRQHRQLHEIGRRVLDLLDTGNQQAARDLIPNLEGMKRAMLQEMAELQQNMGR